MNDELEKKLYEDFPEIFGQKDIDETKTPMCWGCSCDDGWYDIIRDTCQIMDNMAKRNAYLFPRVEFVQVKEKFGTLRIYFDEIFLTKEEFLENDSANVCHRYVAPKWVKFIGKFWKGFLHNYMYKKYLEKTRANSNFYYGVEQYAEYLSAKTCEVCGERGLMCRRGNWLKTLCEKHRIEYDYLKLKKEED